MRWSIYRVDGPAREERLGSVEADNWPRALLKAYDQFGVRTNAEQRKISARQEARK